MGPVALYKLWRAWRKLAPLWKEAFDMPDKKMLASMTVWGAVCIVLAHVFQTVGVQLQHGAIDWGALLPSLAQHIGELLAIVGARRVAGKIVAKGQ